MEHHDHSHAPQLTNLNKAFVWGIALNIIFVALEAFAGYVYNSLALLSDAGHNLGDVVSLVLALLAYKLAKVKPSTRFTYGYRKTTILVSLLNATILLIAMGAIAWESISRMQQPEVMEGDAIAVVAGVGIVINGLTAWLFFKDRESDLNVKGAFLHMAADTLVSGGVVVAGVLMHYTSWYWLDTAVSLLIVGVIVVSTWGLLRDSLVLSLDGVPKGVDMKKIEKALLQFSEIKEIYHLHVWAMSTTQNALTVHMILREGYGLKDFEAIKNRMKHDLEHLSIQHSTMEVELPGRKGSEDC